MEHEKGCTIKFSHHMVYGVSCDSHFSLFDVDVNDASMQPREFVKSDIALSKKKRGLVENIWATPDRSVLVTFEDGSLHFIEQGETYKWKREESLSEIKGAHVFDLPLTVGTSKKNLEEQSVLASQADPASSQSKQSLIFQRYVNTALQLKKSAVKASEKVAKAFENLSNDGYRRDLF